MPSKKISGAVAFAGTMVAILLASVPAAVSGSPSSLENRTQYKPVQSISYEFGSKSMSGYFLQAASACLVTLMISEKSNPEESQPMSPTRVRLALTPGQIAGVDSEEGRSLNFTCGADAATLIVDTGQTEKLVVRQASTPQRELAEKH